jgi:hypothetical protein
MRQMLRGRRATWFVLHRRTHWQALACREEPERPPIAPPASTCSAASLRGGLTHETHPPLRSVAGLPRHPRRIAPANAQTRTAPAPNPRGQRADPHRAANAQTRVAATGRRLAGAGRGARGAAGLGGRGREVDVHQVLLLGRRQRLHARQRGRDLPEERLRASGREAGPTPGGRGPALRARGFRTSPDSAQPHGQQGGVQRCALAAAARTLMLKPALALVSINITLYSRALASPSSIDTCLLSRQGAIELSLKEQCQQASRRFSGRHAYLLSTRSVLLPAGRLAQRQSVKPCLVPRLRSSATSLSAHRPGR